jgi:hypothetical protein
MTVINRPLSFSIVFTMLLSVLHLWRLKVKATYRPCVTSYSKKIIAKRAAVR